MSKSETIFKYECPNVQNGQNRMIKAVSKIAQRDYRYALYWVGIVSVIGNYVIRICFVLRVSDFGFKSLCQWSCNFDWAS